MKCVICHGTEIEKKKVNEEYTVKKDVVYIPVEIPVCKTCGERYYDRKTVKYLEDIENKLERKKVHLKEIGKVKILAA
jgi:YgiT-type zinc finger domain-containing protein